MNAALASRACRASRPSGVALVLGRTPGVVAGLLVLAAALAPSPAAAGTLEVRPTGTLVAGGASNAFLQPGEATPEPVGVVSPRLTAVWYGRRLTAGAGYVLTFQHYGASALTGWGHEGGGGLTWHPTPALRFEVRGGGALNDYDTLGPSGEASTLPIVATSSRALTGGAGLAWTPGSVGLRAGWLVTGRHSTAVFSGGVAGEPVDELVHEGNLQLIWRPNPRARLTLGPAAELRLASAPSLTYVGLGAGAGALVRLWSGGGFETGLRLQQNRFADRWDLFARITLGLTQEAGRWGKVGLRYAYTANGSVLAAFDADRHLVMLVLDVFGPAARWGAP